MPFTKQFFHLRDLQRAGQSPQFGSFKYSAQDLYTKGILLSIDQFSPRQFDRINIVISSDKVGVFTIEVYNSTGGGGSASHGSILVAATEVRMEDLLQAQFENRVSLALFDGMAKFNLNLLLYQINKKCAHSLRLLAYTDISNQVLCVIMRTIQAYHHFFRCPNDIHDSYARPFSSLFVHHECYPVLYSSLNVAQHLVNL